MERSPITGPTLAGLQAGVEFSQNNLDRAKRSIKIHKARVSRPFHDYTAFKWRRDSERQRGDADGSKISRSGKSLLIHFEMGSRDPRRDSSSTLVEATRWKSVLFRRNRFFFRGQSRSRACSREPSSRLNRTVQFTVLSFVRVDQRLTSRSEENDGRNTWRREQLEKSLQLRRSVLE